MADYTFRPEHLQYHYIEQRSPEWFELRCHRVTASSMNKLVTTTMKPSDQIDRYARDLAANKMAGRPLETWSGNRWTDRGTQLEPHARDWYELHQGVDIQDVGFVLNTKLDAGFSPDGITYFIVQEIKCESHAVHVESISGDKPPKKHLPQVQSILAFGGYEAVDLIFYHPELPKKVFRIESNPIWRDIIIERTLICNQLRDKYYNQLKDMDSA